MKRIIISLFVLSLSFSLNSQVDRAGIITKISGREITVRNENPDAPFVMGETLHLLTGDKSVLLQVTFAMQASAKCKLVSGSIGKLKIGSLVYSGGKPENLETNTAKTIVSKNFKSMKIDDFNSFLGFKQGDTIDKAIITLENQTRKIKVTIKGIESINDRFIWDDNIKIKMIGNREYVCYVAIDSGHTSSDRQSIKS